MRFRTLCSFVLDCMIGGGTKTVEYAAAMQTLQ